MCAYVGAHCDCRNGRYERGQRLGVVLCAWLEMELTFLPSGMALKSISTFAWASTSADADMLTRKSVKRFMRLEMNDSKLCRHPSLQNTFRSREQCEPLYILSKRSSSTFSPTRDRSPIADATMIRKLVEHSPWTVAFAPIAVTAPMVPTIKY